MKKLAAIVITAAVCLPIGAFAKDWVLKGHPHMKKAHAALNTALIEIGESQKANEGVWKDEGGHGQKAKEAIEHAKAELDAAAEFVDTHK